MRYKTLNEAIIDRGCLKEKGIIFIKGQQDETFYSYHDLFKNSLIILNNFQLKGLKPGDEVLMQVEDNYQFISVFWACMLGGIIPVPVNVGNNDDSRLKIFNIYNILSNPTLVVNKKILNSLNTFAEKNKRNNCFKTNIEDVIILEEIDYTKESGVIFEVDQKDIAFIQFSSGSTGEAKGVILTHDNLMNNIEAILECSNVKHGEEALSWMPLTHDMGLIGFHLSSLVFGANLFNMPTALFIRHPTLWMKKVSEHKIKITSSPNFGYKYFLNLFKPEIAQDWDLSNVRIIYNGAEPISYELCEEFIKKMKPYGLKSNTMFNVYGLAEASLAVCFPSVEEELSFIDVDRNSISIGKTVVELNYEKTNQSIRLIDLGYNVKGCSIRICDENNVCIPDRNIGYIQIKGDNVTKGYYNNQNATKELFTDDGWLKTGDLGFLRNNRLIVTGRAKDIIFINGQNYYPHDIERVAMEGIDDFTLGEIASCGVMNNETQKEDIYIFIVFKKENSEFALYIPKLKKYIGRRMGIEIKEILPVRKIPKTTSGKFQRYKLAQSVNNGEFESIICELKKIVDENNLLQSKKKLLIDKREQYSKLQRNILDIFKSVSGYDEIDLDENFFDMGASSIMMGQIYNQILELVSNDLLITDFYGNPTIRSLSNYISCKKDDKYNENTKETQDNSIDNIIEKFEEGKLTIEEVVEDLLKV